MTMLIVNILSFYKEMIDLQFSNVNCFKEANFNPGRPYFPLVYMSEVDNRSKCFCSDFCNESNGLFLLGVSFFLQTSLQ